MSYIIEHTGIWFELPTVLALILLVAIIVFFAVKNHNLKKEEKELEDRISSMYTKENMQ